MHLKMQAQCQLNVYTEHKHTHTILSFNLKVVMQEWMAVEREQNALMSSVICDRCRLSRGA